jgi:hypothetical protein
MVGAGCAVDEALAESIEERTTTECSTTFLPKSRLSFTSRHDLCIADLVRPVYTAQRPRR